MFQLFEDEVDYGMMDLSEALTRVRYKSQFNFESDDMSDEKKVVKKTPAKKSAPAKKAETKSPRATPEGHIGLSELAAELDLKPAALRRRLRETESIAKPEGQHGWFWKEGSKDLAAVRKALAKAE